MRTELLPHNQEAYDKVMKAFETTNRTCVVQPTGTGKSYLMSAISEGYKRVLVLAPNKFAIEQVKGVIGERDGIEYRTYQYMMNRKDFELYDLIMLDEFHRCGAEIWGDSIKRLLTKNYDAKVFGTTATPVRYLDGGRNMAEELFNNNVAHELSLAEAWALEILPLPTYVIGLYDFDKTYNEVADKVNNSERLDYDEKKKRLADLENIRIEWTKGHGVPTILEKHLPSSAKKILIFCEDISKLREMKANVNKWFVSAGIKVHTLLCVHSKMAEKTQNSAFETFRDGDNQDGVNILLSVNMLNESIHIKDVDAVIMLRSTKSRIIYLQQMGRCFSTGKQTKPIVFDLVDNVNNTAMIDVIKHEYEATAKILAAERKNRGERRECPQFLLVDEMCDISEIINDTGRFLSYSFEERIAFMYDFFKTNGRVPSKKDGIAKSIWDYLLRYTPEHSMVKKWVSLYCHKVLTKEEKIQLLKDFIKQNKRYPSMSDKEMYKIWSWCLFHYKDDPFISNIKKGLKTGRRSEININERINNIKKFAQAHNRLPQNKNGYSKEERKLAIEWMYLASSFSDRNDVAELKKTYRTKGLKGKCFVDIDKIVEDYRKFIEVNGRKPSKRAKTENPQEYKLYLKWMNIIERHQDREDVQQIIEVTKDLRKPQKQRACSRSQPIGQFTMDGTLIKKYDYISQAARSLGIRPGGISSVVTKKKKSYKGYIWRYL